MKKTVIFLCFAFLIYACATPTSVEKHELRGLEFGTSFNITYFGGNETQEKVEEEILKMFSALDHSLSTYRSTSIISSINRGDTTVLLDDYFKEVFAKSKKIYKETNGVFDPTIGALVNAWGFGPTADKTTLDSLAVKNLRDQIGFDKVSIKNGKIQKENEVYFDFNALAKGYALDIAGRYLEGIKVAHYLIEIGGEIRTRGKQLEKDKPWIVAIESPNFDNSRTIDRVINLENKSMATSGGYRKFIDDSITGKKYIHIIDPKTGYPSQSTLLSVSVVAALDCADVDGYATAILAMGLTDAKIFIEKRQDLMAFLIYSTPDGNLTHFMSSNFEGLNDGF